MKRVLDLAQEEANRLKDEYISTEHIFLAISTERNTASARLLAENGVTRERINETIKADSRRAARDRSGRGEPLSHAGKIQPRSQRAGASRASSIR